MVRRIERWGWLNPDGTPQDEVFLTADEALSEMRRRLGEDHDARAFEIGFRLAVLNVEIRAKHVLRPVGEGGSE